MYKTKSNIFLNSSGPSADFALDPEHGGPILCMDVHGDLVVTGSSDHGLRMYSLSTGKQLKELYSKQYGHTEWVTCVTFLPDSRVVSGGMDSNLCVWESKGVKCRTIMEHTGSISKVISDEMNIVLSSSYDTSVRIYNTDSCECLGILKGVAKAPITEMQWSNSLCVTGTRDGLVSLWDINKQNCLLSQRIHSGQVSKIIFHSDTLDTNLILTAGINDGLICAIDMRSNTKAFSNRVI
jgi:WD40 repeat protein